MYSGRNILMICTRFGLTGADQYLTNELANALVAQGCKVTVVALLWSAAPGTPASHCVLENGVEILTASPFKFNYAGRLVADASKWVASSFFALRYIKRHLADRQFDIIIGFSPLVVTGFIIRWAFRTFKCAGYAYITDFFPFHQRSAGQIPGGPVVAVGRWAESALLRKFSVIGCMTTRGMTYLRTRYKIERDQTVVALPLWGPGDLAPNADPRIQRKAWALPLDRSIAVFGGQIGEGRGVEDILEAARLAKTSRPDIAFLFLGSGRLEGLVRDYIARGGDNVILQGPVGRDVYLPIIAACDVGLVATIANVDVPTFPSKTIDYLRAGTPIAASVEATTDYADFVAEHGFGLAVEAGDPAALLRIILAIVDDPGAAAAMRMAGYETLRSVFNVNQSAARLLDQVGQAL